MTMWHERLRKAMEDRGITSADLVRATGLSGAAIKKWVDGVTLEPRYNDVVRACEVLGVSPKWLMEGKSELVPESDGDAVTIDLVDVKGSCGYGAINFELVPQIKKLQVSKEWFHRNFASYNPEKIKVITAVGDSMSPEINDGDAIFLDISDNIYIRDGIYAALIDDELYIKRVQKTPGKFTFISTNPVYKPFDVDMKGPITVLFIGRVIKRMKLENI